MPSLTHCFIVLINPKWFHIKNIEISRIGFVCLVGWLVGFLTSSSTTRLYRGRASRQSVWQLYVLPHMRQSWATMTSVSAGHILLTPTQRESNSGPPHQESRALPTELRRPPPPLALEDKTGRIYPQQNHWGMVISWYVEMSSSWQIDVEIYTITVFFTGGGLN